MADLEALKSKYQGVIDTAAEVGMDVQHIHIQEEKLYFSGLVATEHAKNAIWDEVKRINPAYDDIWPDVNIGAGKYTVQSGDSLSKISKHFYGDPMRYNEIFEANKPMLKHPDKIYPGQVLRIPKSK